MPPNLLSLPPEILRLSTSCCISQPTRSSQSAFDLSNDAPSCNARIWPGLPIRVQIYTLRVQLARADSSNFASHPYTMTVSLGTHFLPIDFNQLAKGILRDLAFLTDYFLYSMNLIRKCCKKCIQEDQIKSSFSRGVEVLSF